MIFSESKLVRQLPLNRFQFVDQQLAKLTQSGVADIINLGKGNPDGVTPSFIIDSLNEASVLRENHGYTPFNGKENALRGAAEFYWRQYKVELDPDKEVLIFNGAVVGLAAAVQSLLDPGDICVAPDPYYPTYSAAAYSAGAKFLTIPAKEEHAFLPDLTLLDNAEYEQMKLLLLNYPNNPTGAIATRAFFEKAVESALNKKFPIIHDFAYGAVGYGNKPISILEIPHAKEAAVEIYTVSKTYNMAGWRFGFAVGNESVISALKRYHAQFYSTVFGAVQDAAVTALLSDQSSVKEQVAVYRRRRDLFAKKMQEAGWTVTPPHGGLFCWVRVPKGFTSQSFADLLLQEAHVVTIPGSYFGPEGEGFIRFSLLEPEEKIELAVNRISQVMKTG